MHFSDQARSLSLAELEGATGGNGAVIVFRPAGLGGGSSTPPLELASGSNTVFLNEGTLPFSSAGEGTLPFARPVG